MSYKITKLEENIYYYENVIHETDLLIESINNLDFKKDSYSLISEWKNWYASNKEYQYGQKKTISYDTPSNNIQINKECYKIIYKIKNAIDDTTYNYALNTNNLDRLNISDDFVINKYFTNTYMGSHVDSENDNMLFSIVVYLNDNYKGGEIKFPQHNIKIKPAAGSVIIFPSKNPYYHEPLPVTQGEKYMCPGFWYKK